MADRIQFVTLGVDKELFAAPVMKVKEILEMRTISRLPQAPRHFLGIIDVRGQGVPVLDLRLTLGMDAITDTEATRIIVLGLEAAIGSIKLGLRVDRVVEVTVLDTDTLDEPPSIDPAWRAHCVEGIGRRHGTFVAVLDLEALVFGHSATMAAA